MRWDIINNLAKKYDLKSYLEIGLDDGSTFNQVQIENKESCDPFCINSEYQLDHPELIDENKNLRADIFRILTYRMTSDDMFAQNKKKYDLIFIDGLHMRDQVLRDVKNSMEHLNENGFIVMHDCLPPRESCQIVPRIDGEWNGDVWKVLPYLKQNGIEFKVVDEDYGCGIIKYQKKNIPIAEFDFDYHKYFDDIQKRNKELNVITKEEFLSSL